MTNQAGAAPLPAAHPGRLLRIHAAAAKREAHLDGQVAAAHLRPHPHPGGPRRRLQAADPGRTRLAGPQGRPPAAPVFHYREDRIRAHVQRAGSPCCCCGWSRTPPPTPGNHVRHELDRMQLVTLATADGQVAQRSTTTAGQKAILAALELPEPPRFFDFTVPSDRPAPPLRLGRGPVVVVNTTASRRLEISAGLRATFEPPCVHDLRKSGSPIWRARSSAPLWLASMRRKVGAALFFGWAWPQPRRTRPQGQCSPVGSAQPWLPMSRSEQLAVNVAHSSPVGGWIASGP